MGGGSGTWVVGVDTLRKKLQLLLEARLDWEKERCLEGFDSCSRMGEAATILCRALLGPCPLDAVPTAGTSTWDPFWGKLAFWNLYAAAEDRSNS